MVDYKEIAAFLQILLRLAP